MRQSMHENHDPTGKGTLNAELMQGLQANGFRWTRQRKIILDVFMDMDGHPSPEDIRNEIRRRGHKLGLATIYRTMKVLVETGLVHKVEFGDGHGRYEQRDEGEHHLHLICKRCGKTFEAPATAVNALFSKLAKENTFTLLGHTTYLHGICQDCRRAAAESKTKQKKDKQ